MAGFAASTPPGSFTNIVASPLGPPNGSSTTAITLTLPAGSFLLNATLNLEAPNQAAFVECWLSADSVPVSQHRWMTQLGSVFVDTSSVIDIGNRSTVVAFAEPLILSTQRDVSVECRNTIVPADEPGHRVAVVDAQMTAITLGSLAIAP